MTFFSLLDLIIQLVLGIVNRLADLRPVLGGLFLARFCVRVLNVLRGVFHIAPGLFYRAFGLIDDSLVREIIIANGFSHILLDLSNNLVNLPGDLILVHKYPRFLEFKLQSTPRCIRHGLRYHASRASLGHPTLDNITCGLHARM
jgi:hypothetical protein